MEPVRQTTQHIVSAELLRLIMSAFRGFGWGVKGSGYMAHVGGATTCEYQPAIRNLCEEEFFKVKSVEANIVKETVYKCVNSPEYRFNPITWTAVKEDEGNLVTFNQAPPLPPKCVVVFKVDSHSYTLTIQGNRAALVEGRRVCKHYMETVALVKRISEVNEDISVLDDNADPYIFKNTYLEAVTSKGQMFSFGKARLGLGYSIRSVSYKTVVEIFKKYGEFLPENIVGCSSPELRYPV